MILVVAIGLLPLGAYTGYLSWMAYDEPRTFHDAPTLPDAGAAKGTFYKTTGELTATFLSPPLYPEVQGALQYQVSRERHDDGGNDWTQIAVVQAERVTSVHVGRTGVGVTHATRIMGEPGESLRPVAPGERLKITWTKGQDQKYVAYGIFDGTQLGEGRFQRVFLTTPQGERELLELMGNSAWIKALVLAFVGLVSLAMAGFAVRSALR